MTYIRSLQHMNQLSQDIYAGNVAAGWWNTPEGEFAPEKRNRPEILMLIVSELSEAAEGVVNGIAHIMDDKLPHHRMYDVELADAAIRLHDLLGAENITITSPGHTQHKTFGYDVRNNRLIPLMDVVVTLSRAMEGHRKSKRHLYVDNLCISLLRVYHLADCYDIPIDDIIAEKRAFNAVRPDHQIENRMKEGGKKY